MVNYGMDKTFFDHEKKKIGFCLVKDSGPFVEQFSAQNYVFFVSPHRMFNHPSEKFADHPFRPLRI